MRVRASVVKEIFRKSIHLCSGIIPFLLKDFYWAVIIGISIILVFYIVCELLRKAGYPVPFISIITETAARDRDENKFVLGPVTLVIGIILAALLLPPESAKIGIFALAFGDGFASLVGKLIGIVKLPYMHGKTLEGCLACFTAVFISSYLVTSSFYMALFLGLFAMIIEVLPLKDLDNILIPVLVGLMHFFLNKYLF